MLKVGPRTLHTTIGISAADPGRSITWNSAGEEGQSLTFALRLERGETSVSLEVSYEEPGGIGGVLIAAFVEQTVRQRSTTALVRAPTASTSRRQDASRARPEHSLQRTALGADNRLQQ